MPEPNGRLREAIRETRDYLASNSNNYPTDEDALDYLMSECGQMSDGSCTLAGTEQCDFDCPFSA